jgi:hypothetical protein
MWFGVPDHVLVSASLRTVQFQDIWSRSGAVSPERGLALAVVEEALNDLLKYRHSQRRRGQRLYWEAYEWVTDNDREWSYSFVNICETVGLPVEAIREQILDLAAQSAAEATLGEAA